MPIFLEPPPPSTPPKSTSAYSFFVAPNGLNTTELETIARLPLHSGYRDGGNTDSGMFREGDERMNSSIARYILCAKWAVTLPPSPLRNTGRIRMRYSNLPTSTLL